MNEQTYPADTIRLRYSSGEGLVDAQNYSLNRALLFGDGVFETMIYAGGKIRFADAHKKRLSLGLSVLKIHSSNLTMEELETYLRRNFKADEKLRIRWNVYRAGFGKYTPVDHAAEDLVLVLKADNVIKIKSKAYISKNINIPPSPWSHCKTLNGLPYVMANLQRKEMGMEEVILLSSDGFVSEAGSANIFWLKGGTFYTPSLAANCIAGIGREKIIKALQGQNIPVREGLYLPEELLEAEQVFTSNVTGISYIANLEDRTYNTTALPILERLFE